MSIFKDAGYQVTNQISNSLRIESYQYNLSAIPEGSSDGKSFITFAYYFTRENERFDKIAFKINEIGTNHKTKQFELYIKDYTELLNKSLFIKYNDYDKEKMYITQREVENITDIEYLSKMKVAIEEGINDINIAIDLLDKNDNPVYYFIEVDNRYYTKKVILENMKQLIENI